MSLYMLATASNIPMKLLTASALNVLIAIYRILTDESLSSEQMCQLYESLCVDSKTHDWLDVCYHPDTWDTLSELSKSPLFTGIHAGMWSLLHFAHGGEEGLPLNVSGVSDQPNPFYIIINEILHVQDWNGIHEISHDDALCLYLKW